MLRNPGPEAGPSSDGARNCRSVAGLSLTQMTQTEMRPVALGGPALTDAEVLLREWTAGKDLPGCGPDDPAPHISVGPATRPRFQRVKFFTQVARNKPLASKA